MVRTGSGVADGEGKEAFEPTTSSILSSEDRSAITLAEALEPSRVEETSASI